MYKLSIDEIKQILDWYSVAKHESQTSVKDDELATELHELIKDFE